MGHSKCIDHRLQFLLPGIAFLLRWRIEKFVQVPKFTSEMHSRRSGRHVPGTNLNDRRFLDAVIWCSGRIHLDVVLIKTSVVKIAGFEVMHRIRKNLGVRGSSWACVENILEACSTAVNYLKATVCVRFRVNTTTSWHLPHP